MWTATDKKRLPKSIPTAANLIDFVTGRSFPQVPRGTKKVFGSSLMLLRRTGPLISHRGNLKLVRVNDNRKLCTEITEPISERLPPFIPPRDRTTWPQPERDQLIKWLRSLQPVYALTSFTPPKGETYTWKKNVRIFFSISSVVTICFLFIFPCFFIDKNRELIPPLKQERKEQAD